MCARFVLLIVLLSFVPACQKIPDRFVDSMLEGKWELDYALVDGAKKLDYTLATETGNIQVIQPWVSISNNTLKGFDGCNEIWFEFSTSVNGDFQITSDYQQTVLECGPVVVSNKDTGQVYGSIQADGELFAKGWIFANSYKVSENQLVIYFQSKVNHPVFQKVEQE